MDKKPERSGKQINRWFDEKLIEEIDRWRFKNRIKSQKEAMEWLWRYALSQKPKVTT